MSEQDDASVDTFLDDLDDQRDEAAEENKQRRRRADVPKWEHMIWAPQIRCLAARSAQ